MTGKLADTVMSVRNGEQIARKYQPVVFNPSTPAQVAQRAKLKLISQLSAVMAPVISIPKRGPVSSRNLFTKANFGSLVYSEGMASATLTSITLTNGISGLADLNITRDGADLNLGLYGTAQSYIDRVVYAVFKKQEDESLRLLATEVVSEAGPSNTFATTITMDSASNNVVVYAYGIRDNTEAARVIFGNLVTPTAETIAKLVVSRTLTESDITLTETKAVESVPNRDPDKNSNEKKSSKK